jgi:glycogen(starch) synthase
MKVLAITPSYLPRIGGIETLIDSLARPMRDQGVEIAVLTDNAGELPRRASINETIVHRLDFAGAVLSGEAGRPLGVLRQLHQLLEEERPDVLHMHCVTGSSAWYVDRVLKSSRFPGRFIVTQHGTLAAKDRMSVIRVLLHRAESLTAVSAAALRSALDFAERRDSDGVIPNGIATMPRSISAELGKRFTLLCIGRLEREKGFDLAISALAVVRKRGFDAVLQIIGRGVEQRSYERLAGQLGLAEHVQFLGPLPNSEARRILAGGTVILVPSRSREGFSLVAVEAAMSGVPAIVAQVGGLPETVLNGETGVVVPPENCEAIADAVCRLLADEKTRGDMGVRAMARAKREYSLTLCASRYGALYRSLRNAGTEGANRNVVSDSSEPCLA